MRIMVIGFSTQLNASMAAMARLMFFSTVLWVRITISAVVWSMTPFWIKASMDTFSFAKARDLSQRARFVFGLDAQVVAAGDFVHRQDGLRLDLGGLERQMRYAVVGIGFNQACDVDDVGNHGGSGRQCARARAVI